MISLANAFEPSSRAAAARGPKQADPRRRAGVGQPGDERRLGPADHELDPGRGGRAREALDVAGVGARQRRGVARDARVARRAQQLGPLRRARERAHDRVLAPAGADDEDLHRSAQSAAMKSSIGIAASDS